MKITKNTLKISFNLKKNRGYGISYILGFITKNIYKMRMNFSPLFLIVTFCFFYRSTKAQIGIGTTLPHSSAVLDVSSNQKGFLLPRMTTSERNLINGGNPAEGLMVYNTDDNCLHIYNNSSWVDLCNGNTGTSSPSFSSPITGSIGGNYPGYASTSVFQNIKFPKSELITFNNDNSDAVFYIGGNRKKIYTNNGSIYSAQEKYRDFLSFPSITAISSNNGATSTTEVLIVNERIPGKTWKELDYVSRSGNYQMMDLFLLSEDGELYSFCFEQNVVGLPIRGITLDNINPSNDNQVITVNSDTYNGANKFPVYQHFANGTDTGIKFDCIYAQEKINELEYVLFAYSYNENKFYSMGGKYNSNNNLHPTKVSSNKLRRSTEPNTLKDSYTLSEADHINNLLEIFNTKLKMGNDNEVTFWMNNVSHQVFLITEDGYANVINGSSIRRIEFPTGVTPVSYTGAYERAGILGSDGKLYDPGTYPTAYAPIVYTSRNQMHNSINYTIYENLNLQNKLFNTLATDFNNLTLKSVHGYRNTVFLTTDGTLYRMQDLEHTTTNNEYNNEVTNFTSEHSLEPIDHVVNHLSSGSAVVSNQNDLTYMLNFQLIHSAAYFSRFPCGVGYNNKLSFNDKGKAVVNTSIAPCIWYNYLPL